MIRNTKRFSDFELKLQRCTCISQGFYFGLQDWQLQGRADQSIKLSCAAFLLRPYLVKEKTVYKLSLDFANRRQYTITLTVASQSQAVVPLDEWSGAIFHQFLFADGFVDHWEREACPRDFIDAIQRFRPYLSRYIITNEAPSLHMFRNLWFWILTRELDKLHEDALALFQTKSYLFKLPIPRRDLKISLPPLPK
jgi:hypothetical protein